MSLKRLFGQSAPQPAAFEPVDCSRCAIRKARAKMGSLSLCLECEIGLANAKAREFAMAHGLHTREQHFAWIRARLPRIGRTPQSVDDREPGTDEGELIEGSARRESPDS